MDATSTLSLPSRRGPRASTTPQTPHIQLDQFSPIEIQERLWDAMSSWEATVIGRSNVSAPTSRAIHMDPGEAHGPVQAFFVGTEFVHLHGDGSGSVHATLPPELADAAIAQGWGETHPVVKRGFGYPTWVMLYGPRTSDELAVVAGMLQAGYRYARFGETPVVELAGER